MQEKFFMLVEDDADHVTLIQRSLRKQQSPDRMVVAQNGEEALDFLFARRSFARRNTSLMPAVILLDLKLPKLSGHQVLEQIRAQEQTRTIPVVALTSSDEESDVRESYRLGTNSYVCKPVEFQAFMETIHQVIHYWMHLNRIVTST